MSHYTPLDPPPTIDQEMARYVIEELRRIATAFDLVLDVDKLNVAPDKPRDGMIRYADGSNWNPGSGAGLYIYKGSSWVLLG